MTKQSLFSRIIAGMGAAAFAISMQAQDRITTLLPNMNIPVRTTENIDTRNLDYQTFAGVVEQDVRGDDGHLALPRGSMVELIVRRARNDNDMILDLESVTVNGQRYAMKTLPNRVDVQNDNGTWLGAIVGAINGGQYQGQFVRIPSGSVVNFKVRRPMDVNIADRGINRNGRHYHEYYRDYYRDWDRRNGGN